MWDMGLGNGDAETHIGQLTNALYRNVRLISAIGLHTKGMTVDESERLFLRGGVYQCRRRAPAGPRAAPTTRPT